MLIPACARTPGSALSDARIPSDAAKVPVVPFRYLSDRGGSATILDDRRVLTARHAVPEFMLDAFRRGGTVVLDDGTQLPFTGIVLGLSTDGATDPTPGAEAGAGCPLVVTMAGASNADEDDWALLETDQPGCLGAAARFPVHTQPTVADGVRVYLIGYPEPRDGPTSAPPRVTIAGVVEHARDSRSTESPDLLRVRLDHPGDYRGMSGGAAVVRNAQTGRLELVGIIVGRDPTSRGARARHAIIRRVPHEIGP